MQLTVAPQAAAIGRKSYIYAIVAGGSLGIEGWLGVEGKDVYLITDGGVAAVVSAVAGSKIRPARANLSAHQAVLKRLMTETTPLPMAFGSIATSGEAIHRMLGRNRRSFEEQLGRVAGKVEMGLRVAWNAPNIFEYLVGAPLRAARDRLLAAGGEATRNEKIELGRAFERRLNQQREEHKRKVGRALRSVAAEFKANPCRSEPEVMNVACLVRREAQEQFSTAVETAAKLFDENFTFDYNGPWAPYNFVELELDPEE